MSTFLAKKTLTKQETSNQVKNSNKRSEYIPRNVELNEQYIFIDFKTISADKLTICPAIE